MSDTSLQEQFFADTLDLLADAEEYVLHLEKEGFEKETVHSIFRLFHTVKGNSNMVGEGEMSSLTHALESQYDAVRNERSELSPELLQASFEVIDLLRDVCEEGDSAPFREKLSEARLRFESPLKEEKNNSPAVTEGTQAQADSEGAPAQAGANRGDSGEQQIPVKLSERESLTSYREWRPILKAFYEMEKLLQDFIAMGREEGWEDGLMDLGMAAIDLRSTVHGNSEYLEKPASYIEKFLAAMMRENIAYSEISYELLHTLMSEFRRGMWERLYVLGVFRHLRIDRLEAFDRAADMLEEEGVLYVVEIALGKDVPLRAEGLFEKLETIKQKAPGRVVLISPRMRLIQKATALLDQALEGYPIIAPDIEEGVRELLL